MTFAFWETFFRPWLWPCVLWSGVHWVSHLWIRLTLFCFLWVGRAMIRLYWALLLCLVSPLCVCIFLKFLSFPIASLISAFHLTSASRGDSSIAERLPNECSRSSFDISRPGIFTSLWAVKCPTWEASFCIFATDVLGIDVLLLNASVSRLLVILDATVAE